MFWGFDRCLLNYTCGTHLWVMSLKWFTTYQKNWKSKYNSTHIDYRAIAACWIQWKGKIIICQIKYPVKQTSVWWLVVYCFDFKLCVYIFNCILLLEKLAILFCINFFFICTGFLKEIKPVARRDLNVTFLSEQTKKSARDVFFFMFTVSSWAPKTKLFKNNENLIYF